MAFELPQPAGADRKQRGERLKALVAEEINGEVHAWYDLAHVVGFLGQLQKIRVTIITPNN